MVLQRPAKVRNITVGEAYLRDLEARLKAYEGASDVFLNHDLSPADLSQNSTLHSGPGPWTSGKHVQHPRSPRTKTSTMSSYSRRLSRR